MISRRSRSRKRTRHGKSKRDDRSRRRRRSSSHKKKSRKGRCKQVLVQLLGVWFGQWVFVSPQSQLPTLAALCTAGQPKNRDDESTDAESAFGTKFLCPLALNW